jgi:Myb-like DNA-binding domain
MSIDYRKPWTPQEDIAIKSLVEEFGLRKWSIIAQEMGTRFNIKNRSGKQCRERWHNHLDSSIDKKPWTQEEDNLIFDLHKVYGKSWSKIAEQVPGRTDNSVKNRFYSTLRRNLRKYNKNRPHSERLIGSVRTILRNPNIPDVLLKEQAPPRLKKKPEETVETEKVPEKIIEISVPMANNNNTSEIRATNTPVTDNFTQINQFESKIGQGFENLSTQIEEANLLINLSQPELNYFYFYSQALANYTKAGSYPSFICPVFPPDKFPMILPNPNLKPNILKK